MSNSKALCIFCFAFSCSFIFIAHGQTYQDLYKLQNDLFTNYSTSVRPLLNQSQLISIAASFELVALIQVDEVQQMTVVNGFLALIWRDELLTWNPRSYNGITRITPESTLIWKPRMVLLNTMEDRDLFEDHYSPINVNYDGTVAWYPGGIFPSLCQLDLRKFPLDKHDCSIIMAPMYMNASDMTFDMSSSSVRLSLFIPHGEWDVTNTNISSINLRTGENSYYYSIQISLTIKRKEIFFLLNIFFPVFFVGALNVLIFVIPEDEGEKVGFSITVLLAMAVYMEVVSDRLPSNSENMPYMTTYIFILFSMSVLCCVDTIIIVWLHNKEEEEEKRQRRQSILKGVFSKVKNLNRFKLSKGSVDKAKIFPDPSDGPSKVDETQETVGTLVKVSPVDVDSSQAPVPMDGMSKAKILLESLKERTDSNLPPPEIKSHQRDSKGGHINRYKNLAKKLNFYSGILFGSLSLILTFIFFIMITA